MGQFLAVPNTTKANKVGQGQGLRFGLSSMQGWRRVMEDNHTAVTGLPYGHEHCSFFAVFDGHAGNTVSAICADQLIDEIINTDVFKCKTEMTNSQPSTEDVIRAIKSGFLVLDEKIRKMPEMLSGENKSGSTAVCVLVSSQHIFFANCGDSRAVLSHKGHCKFATCDHKPTKPAEYERIRNAGGFVYYNDGTRRLNGRLDFSRALGDYTYKSIEGLGPCEQLVSPEPDITVEERSDGDEFVILASDGVWHILDNEEICDFVRTKIETTSLDDICNLVVDRCFDKGSRDNITIIIVAL